MSFHPVYSVHPAVAYQASLLENLPEKTGRNLEEWGGIVKRHGDADARRVAEWLRAEYGLGRTTAALVAASALGIDRDTSSPEAYLKAAPGYVDALYSGPRESLRPVHDALIARCLALGPDVRICPATTLVSVYRRHVVAQVRPASRARVDLGLALGAGLPPGIASDRVVDTGGAANGDRITHRIGIGSVSEVDPAVVEALTAAYGAEASGG